MLHRLKLFDAKTEYPGTELLVRGSSESDGQQREGDARTENTKNKEHCSAPLLVRVCTRKDGERAHSIGNGTSGLGTSTAHVNTHGAERSALVVLLLNPIREQ